MNGTEARKLFNLKQRVLARNGLTRDGRCRLLDVKVHGECGVVRGIRRKCPKVIAVLGELQHRFDVHRALGDPRDRAVSGGRGDQVHIESVDFEPRLHVKH